MVYGMKDTLLAAMDQGFEVVYFDCHHKLWKPFTSETELLHCSSYYIKKPSAVTPEEEEEVETHTTNTPWILNTVMHSTQEPSPESWRPSE